MSGRVWFAVALETFCKEARRRIAFGPPGSLAIELEWR
jgi:hypothetical protein